MAEVQHDSNARKFYVHSDGHEAHMTYRYRDASTVIYKHTYVPSELRGGGLAGKIVRTALEWARTENLRVVPTCSFVEGFVRKHPEYQDIAEL